MSLPLHTLRRGDSALLINVPHAGTHIPAEMQAGMQARALTVPDTDWHVEKLYAFAEHSGASLMAATHSRYVVDLNRDPEGLALYPGADNTELCPTRDFDNAEIYRPGCQPGAGEVAECRRRYWQPYHEVLTAELAAIRARHGFAVLLDAHSIRSVVPRFFEGRLPDLNLGTADGASCHIGVQDCAWTQLSGSSFSAVSNGRFKGGYITRHYGHPASGQHALQLEIAQCCYMQEGPPYAWESARAEALQSVLRKLVDALIDWRPG